MASCPPTSNCQISQPVALMDRSLRKAATSGDTTRIKQLALHESSVLFGTTPQGNTCLHIASIHGHERFCEDILALKQSQSLLRASNADGETPLLTAVRFCHARLTSVLLNRCRDQQLSEVILRQDNSGCNALHHAIRSGQKKLALDLIETEPALSKAVNKSNESPMFMAVMRNYEDIYEKLLGIPDSAHGGPCGYNALHAAVRNGNTAITKRIMETRPGLAREEDTVAKATPMHLAVVWDKINVLRILLEHDRSLGYVVSSNKGASLLLSAAYRGQVGAARELLKLCPDAPYLDENGNTCLHHAVFEGHTEFVQFVLSSKPLRKLVNMRNSDANTALHIAVAICNPKMVAALLLHQDIDPSVLNSKTDPASWVLTAITDHAKTLNWNEVCQLMLKADPKNTTAIYILHNYAKDKVTNLSWKDIKSLTQRYTSNTSLVAILIATISFAAAFTLPGGYSSDSGSMGLPTMAGKYGFQAFVISNTFAMCSSLLVAFICIIARWEDLEFLLYYRSFTKKLMWFAYMATTMAFASGLYTVLAPRLLWLAISICFLLILLPILTKLLGEWPFLKLRFQLGRTFKSELLSMV